MYKNEDVAVIYDAVLSVPGMEDQVKLNLSISRKKILLLCQVIEAGLLAEDVGVKQLITSLGKTAPDEIKIIAEECLEKAGLTTLGNKLKNLSTKV